MNQKYRLGLRAIKTSVAVFICMIISNVLHRPDDFFAGIAAIICMQQTYDETFKTGLQRFIGTAIGGFTGYVILEIVERIPLFSKDSNVFIIPLCLLIVIYFCNFINYQGSVVIGSIVLISVLSMYDRGVGDALVYVVDRVLDTTMGIIVAMIVNRFFLPKKSNGQSANSKEA